MELTVTLPDPELYDTLRQVADDQGRAIDMIVVQAVREWLERLDESADLAAIAEVEQDETLPWEHVKAEMRAARTRRRAG